MNLIEAFKEGKVREFDLDDSLVVETDEYAYFIKEGEEVCTLINKPKEYWDNYLNNILSDDTTTLWIEDGYYLHNMRLAARDNKPKTLVLGSINYTVGEDIDFKIVNMPSNLGYAILDGIEVSSTASLQSYIEDGMMSLTTERNAYILGYIYVRAVEEQDISLDSLLSKTATSEDLAKVVLGEEGAESFLSILPKYAEFDEVLEMLNTYTENSRYDVYEGVLSEK